MLQYVRKGPLMAKIRRLSDKLGFTLVEALSAAIILGIGLFVLGTVFLQEFSVINKLREMTLATLSAQEEIEQVRGESFDTIKNLGSSFTASGFNYLKNPVGTVTVDNIYGNDNIRRVSVTVSWASRSGATLSKSLVTLVTRDGIDKQ